jgi:transcriptional regulator with XRE-family HTH domain
MTAKPSVQRLLVGTALRRHRELLGYGLAEACKVIGCDKSKLSRIETGQRGIRTGELREILDDYGVCESEQLTLVAIATPPGRHRGWQAEYADLIPDACRDYLSAEALASEMMVWDAQRVPDLLRVREYAHAVAEASLRNPAAATPDRLAEMTMARQHAVIGDQPILLSVVIGEGALRQVVGSTDVMRAQSAWLAAASSTCPRVKIQVMSFDCGTPDDSGCAPMTILRFPRTPSLGVVHLPGLNGGRCLTGGTDVARHIRAFTQLQASALSPAKSVQMLRELAC